MSKDLRLRVQYLAGPTKGVEICFLKDSAAHGLLERKDGAFRYRDDLVSFCFEKYSVSKVPNLLTDPEGSIRYFIKEEQGGEKVKP